jgi:hypothetical protein
MKSTPKRSSLWEIRIERRSLPPTPPMGFIEFWRKKRSLIGQLEAARRATRNSTPFDTNLAVRDLSNFAWRFLQDQRIRATSMKRSARAQRLSKLGNALERAQTLVERNLDDQVGSDLFSAWCAHFGIGLDLDLAEIADNMKETFEILGLLKQIARHAEHEVRPKAGRPIGPTALPHWYEIIELARLYRRNVGTKPTATGPFAKFAHSCFGALGYPRMRLQSLTDAIKNAIHEEARRYSQRSGNPSPFA